MTPRTFTALVFATIIGVVAAASMVIYESRLASQTVVVDEPLFPALVERANDVARIIYRTRWDEAVINFQDGKWVYENKNNYPVEAKNVRSIVTTIASLRRLEPKTDDPEKYSRLSVQGADTERGDSRELVFETSDGTVLAAVIIGRPSKTMQFDPLGGTYIREIGDSLSWLARGTVVLPPRPMDLTKRQIVHVPGPDIREIQIWEDGKEVLHAQKLEDDAGVLRYTLIPSDTKIRAADSAVKQLASGIVSFRFDDVVPVENIEIPAGSRTMEFHTYKGMKLSLTIVEVDDSEAWITFNAEAEAGSEDTERAAEIQAATNGWAFLVPSHKRRTLTREAVSLIENIPDPNAPAPALPPGLNLPGPGGALGRPGVPVQRP